MTLWQETLELLAMAKSRRISVKEMCDGAKVSTRWWYLMMTGEMKDPSVHKVQALHDWLKARMEQDQAT